MRANFFAKTTLSVVFLFSMGGAAFAYIDPGSGSVLTTAILGFVAAIAYTFRKYFYKAKDMLFGQAKSKIGDGRDE